MAPGLAASGFLVRSNSGVYLLEDRMMRMLTVEPIDNSVDTKAFFQNGLLIQLKV